MDEIRQARIDLAAAFRLADRLGLGEGICNHFSLMVPGRSDRFLLNRYGLHWSEITASSLLVVDGEGRLIEGDEAPEPTAFYIHGRLHRANAHARCVLHTHMPYATALTMVEDGRLEMAHQNALRFVGQIAYDDSYNGPALDEAEGDRMVAALGDKRVLFLANHGVIVVGASVAEAFDELYYLERACQTQILAQSMGRPLRLVSGQIQNRTYRQYERERPSLARHFEALKRLLDRDSPNYIL
jgi:ribulose-5-phosphate 4-epimerase/fuculose-1-phosphate aldolase